MIGHLAVIDTLDIGPKIAILWTGVECEGSGPEENEDEDSTYCREYRGRDWRGGEMSFR